MKPLRARAVRARRGIVLVAAALLLAAPARSTWSIVAVDTRTGEICIAAATCLPLDLEVYLPVVRVGVGGACAQSAADISGANRLLIWNGLIDGLNAEEIMAVLLGVAPQVNKQYGIVTIAGEPVAHSGPNVGHARYGVARTIDGVSYAIQGNVLTGIQVITNAENAFLATPGDLSQRVLAAMEAARVFGGDGRCSCDPLHPTACGCPPPSFEIADATAFLLVARNGDVDGTCEPTLGCGTGQYFCNLNVIGIASGLDPVIELQGEYTAWRLGQAGRADQLRTVVTPSATSLPADATSELTVEVELRDIEGDPVALPATLSVARAYAGPPVAKIGRIDEVAPGLFRFPVRATSHAGEGRWRITAHQGVQTVLLWPELVISVGSDGGAGAPAPRGR